MTSLLDSRATAQQQNAPPQPLQVGAGAARAALQMLRTHIRAAMVTLMVPLRLRIPSRASWVSPWTTNRLAGL